MTSSSSAAARPASGSFATPPCGVSARAPVERVDLGQGTTGRFHGLLHSGGRYVVCDPRSATECAEENAIVRRIAAEAVEDTGGLFVTTPADDPDYADRSSRAAARPACRCRRSPSPRRSRREPRLNPGISRAFEVRTPRSTPGSCCGATPRSAREHGARILTYHWVTEILRDGDRVVGRGGAATTAAAARCASRPPS